MGAEKAILIGVVTPEQNRSRAEEYLEELAFLAKTAGAKPVKRFLQQLNEVTFSYNSLGHQDHKWRRHWQ